MSCLLLVALAQLLAPGAAHAVPETELASRADSLRAEAATAKSGTFLGKGGLKLFYQVHSAPREKAALVFLNGRVENVDKYDELYHDLKLQGYSVFTYDHRGQGRSERLLPDPRKLHVVRFQDYVADLEAFLEQVVKPAGPRRLHLVGHSMGGLIGALFLEQHPDVFRSAALLSPSFSLQLPRPELEILGSTCTGRPTDYVRGPGPAEEPPFGKDSTTSSPIRYQFNTETKSLRPEAQVGEATRNWICEMVSAGQRARRHPDQIKTPLFVATATEDSLTRTEEAKKFCSAVKGCRSQIFSGRHNLLIEKDEVRNKLLRRLSSFLEKGR